MKFTAERTCTVIGQSLADKPSDATSVRLKDFASSSAYVLIGEPGAGKTTAFDTESKAENGTPLSVRDFLAYDDKPEWRGATLFLDGLDEVRVGAVDGRSPLDRIRAKLNRLGCPPFRLSCRWADWLGPNDRDHLGQLSGGTLTVLHLDPLTKQDIKNILAENHGIADPDEFIADARERGVDGLLANPQNLDLLAKAVSGGSWPSSRRETFEVACQMLVSEPNSEHSLVDRTAGDTEQLLHEAGRLCAVQLLSGIAGFTLLNNVAADPDYPPPPAVATTSGRQFPVLWTRLFVGTSEGHLVTAHRQIAEFLAARYVSGLLDDGLPLKRVLALVTGFDGELMRPFRNFVAWLGVHSQPTRKQLSRLNPSGLFFAGDRDTFSTEEKRDILAHLRREAAWNPACLYSRWRSGLGDLALAELQDAFEQILSSPDREYPIQPYVMLVLQALRDGEPLPGLVPKILCIVRDPSWFPGVRCAALDVLNAYRERKVVPTDILLELLRDIRAGLLGDPADDLLGVLLKALYPGDISAAEAVEYLRPPKLAIVGSEFVKFWTRHVPEVSMDEQRVQLLDAIAADFESFRPFMTGETSRFSTMGQLPVDLLNSVLRSSIDDIPVESLWDWLLVASQLNMHVPESALTGISFVLERHRDKLKELIAYGVERCACAEDIASCMRSMERTLFRARPFDFGRWCLDRALSTTIDRVASLYVCLLADCLARRPYAAGLTTEKARQQLAAQPLLVEQFDEMMEQAGDPLADAVFVVRTRGVKDNEVQVSCQSEIVAERARLQEGHGSPHLLGRAAQAYFGNTTDVTGESPDERLGRLVGSRSDLAADLRTGLLGVLGRDDLPSPSDVVAGSGSDAMPPLTFPYMAALDEFERIGRLELSELSDGQVHLAVTILHSVPADRLNPDRNDLSKTYKPKWLSRLLQDRPCPIADALTWSIEQKLDNGVIPGSELRALAAEDHREIAALVCLPLMRAFLTESTVTVLESLGWVLNAALKNCDGGHLEQTIRRRLKDPKLPAAQRIFWVAAGFLLAPGRYSRELQEIGEVRDQSGALLDFLCRAGFRREIAYRFDANQLRLLVVLTLVAMDNREVTEEQWKFMSDLIGGLSSLETQEAADVLQELDNAPALAAWALDIAVAIENQSARRREAEFRQCGIDQVTRTLDNGRPANAGDLATLVVAEVSQISAQIRHGSASYWKHFWNVDSYNRAKHPRPEESCRDAILFALQSRLGRLEVDVLPEGTYADEKRADIRAEYGGFNVPVEIKRSCHRDLWTAIRNQLVKKYTRDPGAEGFGIYLVFWFGQDSGCKPMALEGWVPPGARELESRLTELLSDPEKYRISVCVIDVSKPEPSP